MDWTLKLGSVEPQLQRQPKRFLPRSGALAGSGGYRLRSEVFIKSICMNSA